MTQPSQGFFEQCVNLVLFAMHTKRPQTLRTLARWRDNHFRLFGGIAYTTFQEVHDLLAKEGEKLDWLSGPLQARADYLTKSHMPFLMEGPNHEIRRREIVKRLAIAQDNLEELEHLLAAQKDHERGLARFLWKHLGNVILTDDEVTKYLTFRSDAQMLTLLPKWIRSTVCKSRHESAQAFRAKMLVRLEDANDGLADTFFDAIWFNAGTLGFYPEKAIEALRENRHLQDIIRTEATLAAGERPKTRALVNEMLRTVIRIASTNYVRNGDQVDIALIATAVVDPMRYPDPMKIDLDRDHSDALAFAGPAPNRGCPSETFSLDAMACVVADKVRRGAID